MPTYNHKNDQFITGQGRRQQALSDGFTHAKLLISYGGARI